MQCLFDFFFFFFFWMLKNNFLLLLIFLLIAILIFLSAVTNNQTKSSEIYEKITMWAGDDEPMINYEWPNNNMIQW